MKNKLPTALCVCMALLLVLFGVVYGTWSGFREERAQVEDLLTMENGLLDVQGYRAADGLNLCAVAKRHLPAQSEALQQLESVSRQLLEAAVLRTALDQELAQAVEAVSAALQETASFQNSQRDQRYLDMLTADLNSLRASEAVSAYNQAAARFNQQLEAPLLGRLAMLLGVEKCPLYQ